MAGPVCSKTCGMPANPVDHEDRHLRSPPLALARSQTQRPLPRRPHAGDVCSRHAGQLVGSAVGDNDYRIIGGLVGSHGRAPGGHVATVTSEFGGSSFAVLRLPATSGSGTPAIVDYAFVSCIDDFDAGFYPHTLTAYTSPNDGKAYTVFANWLPEHQTRWRSWTWPACSQSPARETATPSSGACPMATASRASSRRTEQHSKETKRGRWLLPASLPPVLIPPRWPV